METREILLKSDKVMLHLERIEGGKIRATTSTTNRLSAYSIREQKCLIFRIVAPGICGLQNYVTLYVANCKTWRVRWLSASRSSSRIVKWFAFAIGIRSPGR